MNIINLTAANEFAQLIEKQHWSVASQFAVLCDFITLQQRWPELMVYAQERATNEKVAHD